jgi:lipoprotein-anchoring transpeptidase ErfK/SrfK
MPFMQRLTWDGIALHAGAIPGEPASHGCVRLPRAFAQRLYGVTRLGAAVLITDEAPATPQEALALIA